MSASNDNEGKKEERQKCVLRMEIVTSKGQKKKKGSKTNKVYTFYAIQGVGVNIHNKTFLSFSLSHIEKATRVQRGKCTGDDEQARAGDMT